MKQTPLLTVVIAGVVGAASAAGTAVLLSPQSSERAQVAAADPLAPKTDYDAQFGELRKQNEDLLLRIAALETRPAPAAAMRAPVGDDGFQDEVRNWMASFEDESGQVPEAFVASVGDALDQIRDQEREERSQQMADAQAERLEERLGELKEKLGLSQYQVDEMRTVLTEQNLKRAELFAGGWENIDRGSMRETMQTMREETDTALATILTPDQLEGYEQSERENRGGFGGFGGGRRGGGGGGGGGGADGGGGGRRGGGR
jgi:hypothetical protein